MSVEYTYSDGNGNTYIIRSEENKTIEYIPVKPRYSSSGLYDGGIPTMKKISDTQYEKIIFSLNDAINNRECHIENRIKTSGMITKKVDNLKDVFFINPKSENLEIIENLLKEIIQK